MRHSGMREPRGEVFGRHAHGTAMPLGRRHTPGVRGCRRRAAVGAPWRVRANTSARALRSQALRTIAPESLRMMVWSFWAADARSEWVAWLRRTAALLPRPRGGQQRCVEGGSSREVVLQRVRPAGRRALMSCIQLLTWSPVLGASGLLSQHGRVPALWVHHDDEGAWRACAELCRVAFRA